MTITEKIHMLHRVWRYRLREEKDSVNYLLQQNLEGATVLDIGANKGIYTYWMCKKVGHTGKVVSFEPQPELGVFLNDMKDAFKLNNVEIVNKGLSDSKSRLNLIRSEAGSGGARLENASYDFSDKPHLQKIEVEVTTLDDYFENRDAETLAFIKCDVENHELQVFKGGEKTLSKYKPILLFECHHEEAVAGNIFSYLEKLGYTGFFFSKGKKISHQQFDAHPYRKASNTHRNYIFIDKAKSGQ